MAKYRVKKHMGCYETSFEVQKKSIFGFWYNYENVDAETTGWYDSLDEAKKSIECRNQRTIKKIVWYDDK